MKVLGTSLLAYVALVCWSAAASAIDQVDNCSTATSLTELAGTILCPQFNIGGATLQSVAIAVSGQITGTLALNNSASTTQNGAATTSSNFNVGALAGFVFVNPVFSASITTGPRTLVSGLTLTVSGLTDSGNGSLGSNSSMLGPYSGTGTFSIPISTATSSDVQGGGGFFGASGFTNASATAVVTYTYAP